MKRDDTPRRSWSLEAQDRSSALVRSEGGGMRVFLFVLPVSLEGTTPQ